MSIFECMYVESHSRNIGVESMGAAGAGAPP